jgi:oligopeptide/dipeptide ABC transporter ATP-binding protein
MARLLEVQDLRTQLLTPGGVLTAVHDVSFTIDEGETVTFIGESGCGKSTLASSVLRLLPPGVGRHAGGSVRFRGTELTTLPERELRELRRGTLALIPQDPMTALNPVTTIGRHLTEVLRLQGRGGDLKRESVELLGRVQIPDPERRLRLFPHQLSGGMLQRVLIAMAIASRPALLVADEPTSALDVTVQADILDLLLDVQAETGMAIMMITHDLGVARQVSDRVNVMYAGDIVESGPVAEVVAAPRMPYTIGLVACTPRLVGDREGVRPVPGAPPPLNARPPGCPFEPRCPFSTEYCTRVAPPLRAVASGHLAACHYDVGVEDAAAFPAPLQPVPEEAS